MGLLSGGVAELPGSEERAGILPRTCGWFILLPESPCPQTQGFGVRNVPASPCLDLAGGEGSEPWLQQLSWDRGGTWPQCPKSSPSVPNPAPNPRGCRVGSMGSPEEGAGWHRFSFLLKPPPKKKNPELFTSLPSLGFGLFL